ncbi:MAG: hypothetical protein ACFE7E_07005 [Candidatus Hodarchaeota archaeon]
MGEISELTEKTAEIRSSDNKRIGAVEAILGNEILMTVSSHFLDRSGRFILPKKMIDKIKRKKIYLTLSEEEFKDWWEEEGLVLETEYLEDMKREIRKAFDAKFGGEEASILLKNNSCPYCGSFIAGKELLLCHYCGLYLLEDSAGNYRVPDRQRAKICLEQEEIIESLPAEVRFTLHSDEWAYYYINIKPKEDGLIVTSKSLIRFKWKGKKKDEQNNWIIPFEKIISVSLVQTHKHYHGFGTGYSTSGVEEPSITLHVRYQTEKKYAADKGWDEKKAKIPVERYSPREIEAIKRYVKKLKEMREIIIGKFVPVSDY